MNKFRNYDLSTAKYTKIRLNPTILHNNKIYDVSNQKSKFFYKCLIQKVISRGNMETIWSKYFDFSNSKQIWNSIYTQKVITPKIIKIAEFNYKILQNILPCGQVLHKWQHNISDKCNHCGEIETVEHNAFYMH